MKKLFTSLIMLMTLSMAAWAQSLKVGDVTVNLAATSIQTITGSKISGKVTYDPNTKTLYLENATINGDIYGNKFGTSSDRHFIHLTGQNTIKSSYHGMRFDNSYVVLYGSEGSILNINTSDSNSDYACIDTEQGHFEVWGIRLIMNGKSCGFYGNESSGTLLFVNSMVTINCEGGAIQKCKSVSFDDCKCITSGATHTSSVGYVGSSGTLLKSLEIWPLLSVGNEPVRTTGDYKYGTLHSWKWTKSTKTLEITGDISVGSYYGIRNCGIDGLTVKTDGAYKISSNWFGLHTVQNTTFSGSGSLTLEGQSSTTATTAGIYVEGNKTITVAMNTLLAQGGKYGIYNPQGTLTLNKLNNNSIYKFIGETANVYTRYLNMNDMDIWTSYSYYNTSDFKMHYKGEVANKENTATGSWFAGKNQITYYPIKVGGTQVNDRNHDNIYSPFITAGTVSYDASTKTLTLNGVTMNSTEDNTYGIWTGSDSGTITIKLVGTNSITTNYTGIGVNNNVVFTGSGNMTLRSNNDYGISCMGSCTKMSIENSSYFIVDSKSFAIYGTRNEVVLKKSDTYGYRFTNTSGGAAIYNIGKLTLDNMDFFANDNDASYAAGCYFDESKYAVVQNGGAAAKKVAFHSIKEKLPIYICGKQLNKVYNNDIIEVGSPYITAGGAKAVCYDPSTKTLTLNNATIKDVENSHAIMFDSGFEGNIVLSGNNNITVKTFNYSGIVNGAVGVSTTFKGNGSLYVKGLNGLMPWKGTMTLTDNVKIEAIGSSLGVGSNNNGTSGETLIVSGNAQLKASTIGRLNTITLQDGQTIVEPRGASIQKLSNGYGVSVDGSTLAQDVVIQKAEKYPIFVCGDQVNSYNCNDILGDGKVKYDPSTKTLTLNNATIDYQGSENDGIIKVDENAEVTITVEGTNTCSGNTNLYSTIWCRAGSNVTINGTGTLKAGGYQFGVYTWNGATAIIKGNVTVESTTDIGSNSSSNMGKLVVGENAVVKVRSIRNVSSLTLNNGQAIVAPAGAQFKNNGVYVDSELAQNVVIMKTEKYPIFVCGDQVNSYNCNDILGDGKVKYDPSTKTLTLDNAAIDYQGTVSNSAGIKVENAKVTIIVKGNNSITGNNNMFSALWLSGEDTDVTLAGNGKLSLSGSYSRCNAVYLSSATLRVGGNVTLEANGNERGIGYNASPRGTLIVGENAIVKASTISSLQTLTLNDNHEIVEPAGAEFKNNGVYVGNTLAQNVVIKKHVAEIYAITIAGTQVTSDNASDILGDGVFSYDAAKNILTINGDYTGDKSAISSYVDDLTIEVAGDCTFTATSRETIIYAINGLTFTGGNLTLASEAPDKDAIGIYVEHGTLYFKDANVDVTGDGFQYAITGEAEVALVIESSNITASAHGEGCFKDFASMTLSGCYIDSPRGTVFENEALRDAEGNVIGGSSETETVVIKSGADAIEGIDATAGQSDIYDVAGRKLGSMSRGINIVRSADGKTRKVLRK